MSDSPTSDAELLAAWVRQRSETAFHTLVDRYARLVHMAARRTCGSNAMAADASQLVFILLDRKAATLVDHVSLAGWLHLTAVRTTRDLMDKSNREARKIQRFQTAMDLPDPVDGESGRDLVVHAVPGDLPVGLRQQGACQQAGKRTDGGNHDDAAQSHADRTRHGAGRLARGGAPIAAEQIDQGSWRWTLGTRFKNWIDQNPDKAIAWLTKHVDDIKPPQFGFLDLSLHPLLATSPETAGRLLAAVPPERRLESLRSLDNDEFSDAQQIGWAQVVRRHLPPK